MADLRGLLDEFAHAMFGAGRATRFRPGYYPFTEPSVAFDIGCLVCDGAGCSACQRTRLDDHPRRRHGPPRRARATAASTPSGTRASPSAWAVDRIAMLRYGIDDIRYFLENDLRFLEQF